MTLTAVQWWSKSEVRFMTDLTFNPNEFVTLLEKSGDAQMIRTVTVEDAVEAYFERDSA